LFPLLQMIFSLPRSVAVAALLTGVFGAATPTPTVTMPYVAVPCLGRWLISFTSFSQCDTEDAQCCKTAESASSPEAGEIMGLLGIDLPDVTVLVGLECSPMLVVDVGSRVDCDQQPVCCTDNTFGGAISLGCTPINVNL
ncbi:fungal hydrophobin, partial [Mycena capillaripes]